MSRVSLKITGAQGQGVNSVGEICAKGLKRNGYAVFAYREYMSLIKGGHSSYQLDISNTEIRSSNEQVSLLVCFNHHGLEKNTMEVAENGIIVHVTPDWNFTDEQAKYIEKHNVTVLFLPVFDILKTIKARPIYANVLVTAVVWSLLGQSKKSLEQLVTEAFAHKGDEIVAKNMQCIEAAFAYLHTQSSLTPLLLPSADKKWKNHLLITGSEALGLGLIHAGCRVYIGYPMTPSSPLLSYIASLQNETQMVIKQAEDEITAVQMASGAMYMGTRAATGTSGGGYDLMTETISLNGMIENPCVIVLAQRPGPATGLPTWTGQGDLLLATFSAHGEFPKIVLSVSDADDAFYIIIEAFNMAEMYQCPVTVLIDKQIAEALYTQSMYNEKITTIDRGLLVRNPEVLLTLTAEDRYNPSVPLGISPRWLPGSNAETYVAQGDEHNANGSVDESADNAVLQMEKRMKKVDTIYKTFPEPEIFGSKKPEILLIGWGSTKGPILDAIAHIAEVNPKAAKKFGYLHYTHMWPLKTEFFKKLYANATATVVVEGNYQGQLAMLLQQEAGVLLDERILKYDGRPFFLQELVHELSSYL